MPQMFIQSTFLQEGKVTLLSQQEVNAQMPQGTLGQKQVLNEELYRQLICNVGPVRVVNLGQNATTEKRVDRSGTLPKLQTKNTGGEHYYVNCPFCRDTRHRLSLSYLYGTSNGSGDVIKHLAHCFNENCLQDHGNREALFYKITVGKNRTRTKGFTLQQPAPPTPAKAIEAPASVPLEDLPGDHPALRYLAGRGFDPKEVSANWGVRYCAKNDSVKPFFRNRLLIPLHSVLPGSGRVELKGWQARSLDPGNRPKYLTSAGSKKSALLYGEILISSGSGPVVVCEGPTDVWRLGRDAVAILGKQPSTRQIELLLSRYRGRTLVIGLDADALEESSALKTKLEQKRRSLNDPAGVRLVELPLGVKDFGDLSRRDAWRVVGRACSTQVKLSYSESSVHAGGQEVVVHEVAAGVKLRPKQLGQMGARVAVCLSRPPGGSGPCGCALVGEDGVVRRFPAGAPGVLQSLIGKTLLVLEPTPSTGHQGQSGAGPQLEDLGVCARILSYAGLSQLEADLLSIRDKATGGAPGPLGLDGHTALALRKIWDEKRPLERLEEAGLGRLYREVERPFVPLMAEMRRNGLPIDLKTLRAEVASSSGGHRRFFESLFQATDPIDHRARCELVQVGTRTGRCSARRPNLMATPAPLKKFVKAGTDRLLVEIDIRGFEPTVLAGLCGPSLLSQQEPHNQDIYDRVAGAAGITCRELSERRRLAKQAYSQWAYGPPVPGSFSLDELFPGVVALRRKLEEEYFKTNLLKTTRGRVVLQRESRDRVHRGLLLSSLVQGEAADIFKILCSNLLQLIQTSNSGWWKPLITVHDSLLLEAPNQELPLFVGEMYRAAVQAAKELPFGFDFRVAAGERWSTLRVLDPAS